MFRFSFLFIILIICTYIVQAQPLISPMNRFDIPRSELTTPYTIETPVQLFILRTPPQHDEVIELGFHRFNINPPDTSAIYSWSIATVNLSSGDYIHETTELVAVPRSVRNPETGGWDDIENPPQPVLLDIVHDASSVVIANQHVVLEDAHSITPPSRAYPFVTIDLEQAGISPDEQWVGGILSSRRITDSPAGGGPPVRIPALWNRNGYLVYRVEYPVPFGVYPHNIFRTPSEIKFSPDSRFFIARGLETSFTIVTPGAYESTATVPVPGSVMVDTQTLLLWETEKDVAFTSDSHFFVTERNGVPTLVDVFHNRNLQTYDLGDVTMNFYTGFRNGVITGSISTTTNTMLAAAFSNDDQTLYIAAIDGSVYVFPSQLPTSQAEMWEVYE